MGNQEASFDQLFPPCTYTVYDHTLLQRSRVIFDLLTLGSVSVLCASGRQLQGLGPRYFPGCLTRPPLLPCTVYASRTLAHSAVCSIRLAHLILPLPSRGTQIIIGAITTENVLAAGSCFTRELVSLILLPCVNCTDSMIPEQKIQLL